MASPPETNSPSSPVCYMPNPDTSGNIATSLKGQSLRIPNLRQLFQSWPEAKTNIHHQSSIAPLVDSTIRRIATIQPSVERRLQDDLGLLTCLWYPTAGEPQLRALALFTVWMVCWDDEVDANEGDLAGDLSRADEWRQKTLEELKRALGLSSELTSTATDAVNAVLSDLATNLEGRFTTAQRERVFNQVRFFIQSCAAEQKLRLANIVPNYDDYMTVRLGTVGGGLLCSFVDYAQQIDLPERIATSSHREAIDTQVSVLLALMNDLLSLKKELRTGCVINAVVALLRDEKKLDDVVVDVQDKLKDAVIAFDKAAVKLLDEADSHDAAENDNQKARARASTQSYIDGCRAIVTGTLDFT